MGYEASGSAIAALDLGTTNCRLLVARPAGAGGYRVIDSFSRIVRLGEGLETGSVLGQAAMDRTVKALDVCAGKLAQWRVGAVRAVATEACRRAANCAEFVARVREETGIALEIITAAEEARLVLAGCMPLLDARHGHAIVFDIGGGSTEILFVAVEAQQRLATTIRGVVSLPWGVVSLTERFGSGAQDEAGFTAMVGLVRDQLAAFDERHAIGERVAAQDIQMLGSSGTVTTLAAIDLGLARYDRARVDGVALDVASVRRLSAMLAAASPAERAAHSCIGPGRADLMVAGCAILTAICDTWPVPRLRVADRGVREGILTDLLARGRMAEPAAPAPALPLVPQAG
ncbi:MAG TPA: Ppx/GppA phosphatase family protein [Stellaceae bacterium]|nr:Ppx/GppA phosphatase family protein [Stellaceae bacterium]